MRNIMLDPPDEDLYTSNLYSSKIWATNTTIPEMKRTQCTFKGHLSPFCASAAV